MRGKRTIGVFLFLFLASCDQGGGSKSAGTNTGTSAAECSSPSTVVVDKGIKGTTAGVQRGLWSDTKMIPGTTYPATAYYDGSATGGTANIRFTYWDGSKFAVESVTGDTFVAAGSATWVKLGFLSLGANKKRPIIVWTTGATTVKAAMRSEPLGTAGTWATALIDTVPGAVTRNASLSVSPADHVAIAYATNSTSAGRIRFIYCEAPCGSLADFTTMTAPADNIENSTQGANIAGIDTAWCKFDATTYYPSIVYHGNTAANVRYSVCANASLSSCQTSAGWTPSNVVGAGSPVHMSMYVDPNVIGDNVRVLVKSAAGTAMASYSSAAGCAAPGAFTAGSGAVGGTTAGTAWAKIMRDAGGLYHVVANTATTSVSYLNSATSNLLTTTWNAAGTIETATLPAVNVGAGGAVLDNTNGMIYSSFGVISGTFNLTMGIVNDITIPSNNAAAVYYSLLPDTTGGIDVPLLAGNKTRNVSMAATSSGSPGIAYIDHSVGTLAAGRLKYAFRNGTSSSTAWDVVLPPSVGNPLFPWLAYDHNDLPWISFYDSLNFRYYLATNSSKDGTGTWTLYQAPIGPKTASSAAPATDDTAVVMYYNGAVSQPVLLLLNGTGAGGTGLRAIRLDPVTGQFGNLVTVDPLGASYATRLSADYDKSGNMVVAYYDLTSTTVRFNFSQNGGATWKPASAQISSPTFGREGLSIRLNPSNSKPAVAYYQASSNKLYYATCTTSLASCNNVANWTTTNIQDSTAVGVSGVTAVSHEQMLDANLTFNSAGVPYVAYMTGIGPSGVNPGLALTDATTGWTPTLPVMLATTGSAALSGTSAISFGQYGANVSSVRNSLGQFLSAHVGPNNWLYATTCGD